MNPAMEVMEFFGSVIVRMGHLGEVLKRGCRPTVTEMVGFVLAADACPFGAGIAQGSSLRFTCRLQISLGPGFSKPRSR